MRPTRDVVAVKTAGLANGRPEMEFNVGVSRCGDIADGIVVRLPREVLSGPWVIPFSGLERVYLAAKAARARK